MCAEVSGIAFGPSFAKTLAACALESPAVTSFCVGSPGAPGKFPVPGVVTGVGVLLVIVSTLHVAIKDGLSVNANADF
jgi:hypothetical protein